MAEVKGMVQMVRRTIEKYNRISDTLDELSRRL